MENYYDKSKLSLNVFEDFEKQTSWQSYTTLLITDISHLEKDKDLLAMTLNGGTMKGTKGQSRGQSGTRGKSVMNSTGRK